MEVIQELQDFADKAGEGYTFNYRKRKDDKGPGFDHFLEESVTVLNSKEFILAIRENLEELL